MHNVHRPLLNALRVKVNCVNRSPQEPLLQPNYLYYTNVVLLRTKSRCKSLQEDKRKTNPIEKDSNSTVFKRNLSITQQKMSYCLWEGKEKYKNHFVPGVYCCSECGYELFSSRKKFEHSSPWPAFTETIHPDSVSKHLESQNAYKVKCGKCSNPLGHEFLKDGPSGKSRF